jgi:hypothetical protein
VTGGEYNSNDEGGGGGKPRSPMPRDPRNFLLFLSSVVVVLTHFVM